MSTRTRARRRAVATDLPVADINTTPLIDVMLVLLVMIIITIPVQLHAVNLHLPVGDPPRASRVTAKVRAASPPTTRSSSWRGTTTWTGPACRGPARTGP